MNLNPRFLELNEVLYFHEQEIKRSGGTLEIRDIGALKAAISAPKATFSGKFLMDIFEMAAAYINSICFNHPFLDGNKRTGAVAAAVFLAMNGIELDADPDDFERLVRDVAEGKTGKDSIAQFFRRNS